MGKRQSVLQAGNIIFGLATIVINILAGIGLINNTPTAAVSDRYPNLITPSGITFAIWGVIYALVIVFLIVQSKGIRKGDAPDFVNKISVYFILACIANIIWIFVFQYNYITWTLVPMVLLLLVLIESYTRLGVGKTTVSKRERYGVHLLFSVYLGWITVATIANIAAYLVAIQPPVNGLFLGLSEMTWFSIVVSLATIVAILVIWTRRDIAYMLVFVWAYIGIIIKRMQPDKAYAAMPILAAFTAIMLVIIIFAYIIRLVADRASKEPPKKAEEEPKTEHTTDETPAVAPGATPEPPSTPPQ
jgi:hypothetical protein